MRRLPLKSGVTLIELMVVVSIVSMLASAVLVSIQGTRIQALSTKYAIEIIQLKNALLAYRENHGFFPPCPDPLTNGCHDSQGQTTFDNALQVLVTEGLISKIPHAFNWPNNASKIAALPSYEAGYAPGFYDPLFGQNDFVCGTLLTTDWVPGTLPGVIAVSSSEHLPLPNIEISSCDTLLGTCHTSGATYTPAFGGRYTYCVNLEY